MAWAWPRCRSLSGRGGSADLALDRFPNAPRHEVARLKASDGGLQSFNHNLGSERIERGDVIRDGPHVAENPPIGVLTARVHQHHADDRLRAALSVARVHQSYQSAEAVKPRLRTRLPQRVCAARRGDRTMRASGKMISKAPGLANPRFHTKPRVREGVEGAGRGFAIM